MNKQYLCKVCGKSKNINDVTPAAVIRPEIVKIIKQNIPDWQEDGFICNEDLKVFREKYIHSLLEEEKGELSDIEQQVIDSLREHDLITKNVDTTFDEKLTIGQKLSDKMAVYGGSWRFIISFTVVLIIWISVNSYILLTKPFDPFPFILLNLVLSCIAAIQAPIIMMSQNRQEAKDRLRAQHDYQINLKAELEIRTLHQKIDHLLSHQWERLIQIQQIQLEIMNEIKESRKK
jgi:uncharacterized membrane protein